MPENVYAKFAGADVERERARPVTLFRGFLPAGYIGSEEASGALVFVGLHDSTRHDDQIDQIDEFATFVADICADKVEGKIVGGVALGNGTIITPKDNPSFAMVGDSLRAAYIADIGTDGQFRLIIDDRLGIWTGQIDPNLRPKLGPLPPLSTINALDARSQPAPFNLEVVKIEHISWFGEGQYYDGTPVAKQRGIAFVGRQDNVGLHDVRFTNYYGTALHLGRGDSRGNGGVRESSMNHVVVTRCGSPEEPAMIIDGVGRSFGPNLMFFYSIEVSLSRGDGLHIRSATESNTIHALYFFGLKMHGTGHARGQIRPPLSRRALIIEGKCADSIEFRGAIAIQQANIHGDYAINLIGNPLKPEIDCAIPTRIGADGDSRATMLTKLAAALAPGQVYDNNTDPDEGDLHPGHTLAVGDRVAVPFEIGVLGTLAARDAYRWPCGLYEVMPLVGGQPQPAKRVNDANTDNKLINHNVRVKNGFLYGGKYFRCNNVDPFILEIDPLFYDILDFDYPRNVLYEGAVESSGVAKKIVKSIATAHVNLAAPGATINGSTAFTAGQTFVVTGQTISTQNGHYQWNGASTPATRYAGTVEDPHLGSNTGEELVCSTFFATEGAEANNYFLVKNVGVVVIETDANYIDGHVGLTPIVIEKVPTPLYPGGGIFIEGGGYNHFKLFEASGLIGDTIRLGPHVSGPNFIDIPISKDLMVISCDPKVSHHAKLIKSTLPDIGARWTRYEAEALAEEVLRAEASAGILPGLNFEVEPGTYQFLFNVDYETLDGVNFRYSLIVPIGTTIPTNKLTTKTRAPGAIEYTVTVGSTIPADVIIDGGTGGGSLILTGLLVITTVGSVAFRCGQGTLDALNPVLTSGGSFYEMKRLVGSG